MKLPRIRESVRQYLRDDGLSHVDERDIEQATEEAIEEVEDVAKENADTNRSLGTLISNKDVQPFEKIDATIGEIQEDVDELEDLLDTLASELEAQEEEYGRITSGGEEDESIAAREIRAQRAYKERLMYKAKLRAFKDLQERLQRKVNLLSEMVTDVAADQNQNFSFEKNADEIKQTLDERRKNDIRTSNKVREIDSTMRDMHGMGEMSPTEDMKVIEEQSGKRKKHGELEELHKDLYRHEAESSDKTTNENRE